MAVCKTCEDCNHTCLGYDEPATHIRSKSDTASQRPTLESLSDPNKPVSPRASRAIESDSPEPPRAAFAKSPQISRIWDPKDASPRIKRETERNVEGDSPTSSKLASAVRSHAICLPKLALQAALHLASAQIVLMSLTSDTLDRLLLSPATNKWSGLPLYLLCDYDTADQTTSRLYKFEGPAKAIRHQRLVSYIRSRLLYVLH